MVTLNDYLYSGDTIFKIIQNYMTDLRKEAKRTHNEIDLVHSNCLLQVQEMLEHNDFLTSQSQKIREFYKYMAKEFRDIIAYRIVIALPKCHLKPGQNLEEEEMKYLYQIANALPGFLEERGFTAEPAKGVRESKSDLLDGEVKPYYRDFISNPTMYGYQSLHITFYDNTSRSYMEVQLRTKKMDDIAEIGPANHLGYEKRQEHERARRDAVPKGECIYFDEAYERGMKLFNLDLKDLDVNMFAAMNNSLINDGCGLYRGRLILPYEHLSRFQNDLID